MSSSPARLLAVPALALACGIGLVPLSPAAADAHVVPIAAVQGTGASSPLAGQVVTTQGVLTAVYPDGAGSLNGFFLQTGGTGGGADPTPGASDGLFVFGGSVDERALGLTVGDSVEVTGTVGERRATTSDAGTSTQMVAASGGVSELATPLAAVTPAAIAYPTTEEGREAHEGELLAPTDRLTVTNTFSTNQFGEIGLATGDSPLVQPTEVEDAQTGDPGAVAAANARRAVTLDDGASLSFTSAAGRSIPLPWLSPANPIRVGARATLTAPVVLAYAFGAWRLQPQQQVTGDGTGVATFDNTRTPAPAAVPGALRLATFNLLNYFPTTGEEYVASGLGTCTYFTDRAGNPITVNTCTNNGPRGAANPVNLERQQAKTVAAINRLGASIVGLEELENSERLGKDRDVAISQLVAALNAAAGPGTWAFVPSPAAEARPSTAQEDVIRTGLIYRPAEVALVGASEILVDEENFDNAREPLAQAFKPAGATDDQAFVVVVNHLKSKSDSSPPATGDNAAGIQGAFNGDRVRQAQAVVSFAESFAARRGTSRVFLAGDFNAYSQEDPMQVLYGAGYTAIESDTPGEETYSFSGLSGSLDHILGSPAAMDLVTGADIWNINSGESVAFEYSRYNANVTDLYAPDQFRSSDHDPEIVGLDPAAPGDGVSEVNLLNINDFHGRIDANTTRFATTVEQLRAAAGAGSTLFLSAGDNIGASLFASAVQDDAPTLDVLDALGLATSAVGNHEFDRGFTDLTGRVADRADWDYLGANVYEAGTTTPALPEYRTFEVDGVAVGVVGAVTEETPSLVNPDGVAALDFGDPVTAVNRVAARLSDGDPANGEVDVLVAEYHDGAGAGTPDGSTYEEEVAAGGAFADIATRTSAEVDAIFTGHTHKQYAWDAPVPGEPTRTRPILQTGSYGEHIGQIELAVDTGTGEVTSYTQRNVPRASTEDLSFPRVAEVKRITDAALAHAAEVGNRPIAEITDDITTAYSGGGYVAGEYAGGSRDNRAAESTLGGLVANALRDGVSGFATPDLGLTNPGGLRADLLYAGNTAANPADTDGVVTYAEANAVLPFNNTVSLVDLTGAELLAVLEQQWQTSPDGTVPSRPYLQLGLSDNVQVTADATEPAGSRITSVRVDGRPVDPAATYTVSTLSFLAAGGDNFRAFRSGTATDTGLLDAQLWRDYLASRSPLTPDFARQQVFESGLPVRAQVGDSVSVTLGPAYTAPTQPITGSTLDLTSLGSPANSTVTATGFSEGATYALGTFPVTGGTARVELAVPATMGAGGRIELVAAPSGTTVTIPVTAQAPTSVTAVADPVPYGAEQPVDVEVSSAQQTSGTVEVRRGDTVLGSAAVAADGSARVTLPPRALPVGTYTLTAAYAGDGANAPSSASFSLEVVKATPTLTTALDPAAPSTRTPVLLSVSLSAPGQTVTGQVQVTWQRRTVTAALVDGRATVDLGRFRQAGTYPVAVSYLGSDTAEPVTRVVSVRVTRR